MTIEPAVICVVSLSIGYAFGGLLSHRLVGGVIVRKDYLLSLRETIASAEHAGIGMIRSYGRLHEAHRVAIETVHSLREDKKLLQAIVAQYRASSMEARNQ